MIGIFGLRHADSRAPADLRGFAATVPQRYRVDASSGLGGALGLAAHPEGFPDGRAVGLADREVVATGAIFNLADFAAKGWQAASAAELVARLYDADKLSLLAQANGQFAAARFDA